ncbi:hypothetical protein [Ectobacillus ponti]|uniref:Uncharacterized protein n=1 Tax=Ectobacillus ponti TaxID=2961894 RepID=A0AA41X9D3_9BACI|nr:hypothetical protein [Ectobacillus ponti]MCP8968775.1 hypothetical protein [Ectobacillus ponti]
MHARISGRAWMIHGRHNRPLYDGKTGLTVTRCQSGALVMMVAKHEFRNPLTTQLHKPAVHE